MHKLISIFLLLSTILFANPALDRFDKIFSSAPRNVKTQIHEDLKKVYMSAILNSDTNLKKSSLTRLIKSAKTLGLNYKGYELDLQELEAKDTNTKSKTKAQSSTKVSSPIQNKKQGSQQIKEKPLYLLSATKGKDGLVLKFNQEISSGIFKFHSFNNSTIYRNIVDFNGILNGKKLNYKNYIVDEIKIAQFNKNSIRIVFISKSQQNLEAKIMGNTLTLNTKKFINNIKPQQKLKDKTSQQKSNTAAKNTTTIVKIQPKVIVIDPGHGGSDPGAISTNGKYKEKVAVLSIAKKLGEELKKQGHKVYFTRSDDTFINLRTRTKMANDKMADLFISVHANAAPNSTKAKSMQGIETFFLSPARSERSKNAAALENKSDIEEMNYFSQQTFLNFLNREKIIASNKLAIDIQREILKNVRVKYKSVSDGGVREAPFWVLVGALMPAVLIEIGYITHPDEGPRLYDSNYQNLLVKGIAKGLKDYLQNNR